MNNENNTEFYDENTGEILIDGDRGTPGVAQSGSGRVLGMVAFGLFGVLALGFVIYDGIKKESPAPETTKEEIVFNAPKPRDEPYIVETIEQPPQAPLNTAPEPEQIDPALLREQQRLMEEALRRAQEKQQKMEARMKAPQVIYDQPSSSAGVATLSSNNASQGGATLLSGGSSNNDDPNVAFANAQRNIDVPTAKATQLQNMDTLIAQGKMINGILETAIHSDLPGMVRAITSEDVYSFDSSTLLIPKGARLVGQYRSGIRQGQSRVFVIWNRMIRPDGASIDLGSIGTDALGRSGLEGEVDSHFMERFGSSVLLSIIDGALAAGVSAIDNDDASTVSLNGSSDFSRSSEIALENSINIKPTIHIDQGKRIKIFVGKDLDFSDVGGF